MPDADAAPTGAGQPAARRRRRRQLREDSAMTTPALADDIPSLRRVLRQCRTIAVVGLSAEWHRPSYFAAKYMQQHGYRVVPVNPRYAGQAILGERCWTSLTEIPFAVDMVDVFRRTEDVGPVADLVLHSATKYLGGHGTTLGGVVVEGGQFPWDNGKFPGMVEPSPGYHGVKFFETFGDFAFTMRARMETLRVYGAALSPTGAWQILQGVETLHLRMERHCRNARRVAEFLRDDPRVSWVNYPGLPDHPQHALAARQFRSVDGAPGCSGLLAFGVQGAGDGLAAGERFIEAARFMSHVANIGDTRTLVIHPASTTHRQLDAAQQRADGVPPDMVRLSVGIEHIDDILWDIDQALAASAG